MLFRSYRLGLGIAIFAAAANFGAALVHPYPLLAGLYMGLLAGASAYQARRGLHSVVTMVPLFAAFILVSPPTLVAGAGDLVNAALVGFVALIGGLWSLVAFRVVLGSKGPSMGHVPVTPRVAVVYAVSMGVVVGTCSWGLLALSQSQQGAWLILTVIVIMQPSAHDTIVKTFRRVVGTLLGVVVAAIIGLLVPWPTVDFILAMVFVYAAFVLRFGLHRPYWEYVALLTPAVVLMGATSSGVENAAEARLVFTLIGGAMAVVVALIAREIALRMSKDEQSAAR